jgi:hypothetical protein
VGPLSLGETANPGGPVDPILALPEAANAATLPAIQPGIVNAAPVPPSNPPADMAAFNNRAPQRRSVIGGLFDKISRRRR